MPTLKRRLDGGFFVRAFINGHFVTWQVSPEGVAYLRQQGIKADDSFPTPLLHTLKQLGFLVTGHGGTGSTRAVLTLAEYERSDSRATLAITEDKSGWRLMIRIPVLTKSQFEKLSVQEATQQLTATRVTVDTSHTIPGTRLWPGNREAMVPVEPHTRPYRIAFEGPWPPLREYDDLSDDVDGLGESVTVFCGDDRGGVRLPIGEQLIPEADYYLVVYHTSDGPASGDFLPGDLSARLLGAQGPWHAFIVSVPSIPSPAVYAWAQTIGRPVAEPKGRAVLLSPPIEGFSSSGWPIIHNGNEAVILISWSPRSARQREPIELIVEHQEANGGLASRYSIMATPPLLQSDEVEVKEPIGAPKANTRFLAQASYVTFPLEALGTYRLYTLTDSGIYLVVVVDKLAPEPTFEDLAQHPLPLCATVELQPHQPRCEIDALRDGRGPHRILVPSRGDTSPPNIGVVCPTPIDITWSTDLMRKIVRDIASSSASALLVDALGASLSNGKRIEIVITAGAFGSILLDLSPDSASFTHGADAESAVLPGSVTMRARWLMYMVQSHHVDSLFPVMSLNSYVVDRLGVFAKLPELAPLAAARQIPVKYVPHLMALIHLVEQLDHASSNLPSSSVAATRLVTGRHSI